MSIKLPFTDYGTLVNALETWGVEEQFGMAVEECGELLTAINQLKRGRIDKSKLATEVADVFIMMNQLAIIAGEPEVQEQIEYKLRRLKERLSSVNAISNEAMLREYETLKASDVSAVWDNGKIVITGFPPVQPEDPQPV